MRVFLSAYGSRVGVEPVVGLSAQLRAARPAGAGCPRRRTAWRAEACDAPAATGVMRVGVQL
jgi:hypothetical protein